jgi:hypothetical protein
MFSVQVIADQKVIIFFMCFIISILMLKEKYISLYIIRTITPLWHWNPNFYFGNIFIEIQENNKNLLQNSNIYLKILTNV